MRFHISGFGNDFESVYFGFVDFRYETTCEIVAVVVLTDLDAGCGWSCGCLVRRFGTSINECIASCIIGFLCADSALVFGE